MLAEAFVISDIDSEKLDASMIKLLEGVAPVRIARLNVTLKDEGTVLQQLLAKLPAR